MHTYSTPTSKLNTVIIEGVGGSQTNQAHLVDIVDWRPEETAKLINDKVETVLKHYSVPSRDEMDELSMIQKPLNFIPNIFMFFNILNILTKIGCFLFEYRNRFFPIFLT